MSMTHRCFRIIPEHASILVPIVSTVIMLVCVIFTIGCSSEYESTSTDPEMASFDLGPYTLVSVGYGSPLYTRIMRNRQECVLKDKHFIFVQNTIFINDQYFGDIREGDILKIEDSVVTVNNEIRTGRQISDAENDILHPIKQRQLKMGKYKVHVRARHTTGVETTLWGKRSLTADGQTVTIKRGLLYVDEKFHTELQEGDQIFISPEEVTVRGSVGVIH